MPRTKAHAYPVNYLSRKLGASVTTQAELAPESDVGDLLSDDPVSNGGFEFADVDQRQVFTVDLGRPRAFDRVEFGSDNAGPRRQGVHQGVPAQVGFL